MITASIGIFDCQGTFYLQIISADAYQFYYCEMNADAALLLSLNEALEIEKVSELPEGDILKAADDPLTRLLKIYRNRKLKISLPNRYN